MSNEYGKCPYCGDALTQYHPCVKALKDLPEIVLSLEDQTIRDAAIIKFQASTIATLQAQLDKQSWISIQTKLPTYGEPVLLSIGGVTQHVIYQLDGDDDVPDWFGPHHFDYTNETTMFWHDADYWMYVDSLPSPPKGIS